MIFLGLGGFGFGVFQTATTSQLTSAIKTERAPDLSGVLATMTPIAAVLGIATFGSAYLLLAEPGGAAAATRAFSLVSAAFAASTAVTLVLSVRATLRSERIRAQGLQRANLELVQNVDGNRDLGVA